MRLMRFTRWGGALAAAALAGSALISLAPAANALPGEIFNPHSGKCIGIANGNAGVWVCTNNPDQTWFSVSETSDGWVQLINRNGDCLELSGPPVDGAPVVATVTACGGTRSSNPRAWWKGLNCHIVNAEPVNGAPQVLAVQSESVANGAPVITWHQDGSPDQNWQWGSGC